MPGGGKFQPATHDGAVHCNDNRQAAILNKIECPVPVAGNLERLIDIAFLVLRQIEPGTEMIAIRAKDNGQRILRRRRENNRIC